MSLNFGRNPAETFLIGVSFFGLFLVIMLAFRPPVVHEGFALRKLMIGSIFGLLYVLGVLATFFPKQCSAMFDFRKEEEHKHMKSQNFVSHRTSFTLHGHHPDCSGFSAHVFTVKNRRFCAACTGLLLGGVLALCGSTLYFFGDLHFGENSLLVVLGGVLGIGFGLFQFKAKRSSVRLFLNTSFVLGTFLILVGVDELARSVFVDLFLFSLSVLWLFTRISLSQSDHKRICSTCSLATCRFRNGQR